MKQHLSRKNALSLDIYDEIGPEAVKVNDKNYEWLLDEISMTLVINSSNTFENTWYLNMHLESK